MEEERRGAERNHPCFAFCFIISALVKESKEGEKTKKEQNTNILQKATLKISIILVFIKGQIFCGPTSLANWWFSLSVFEACVSIKYFKLKNTYQSYRPQICVIWPPLYPKYFSEFANSLFLILNTLQPSSIFRAKIFVGH